MNKENTNLGEDFEGIESLKQKILEQLKREVRQTISFLEMGGSYKHLSEVHVKDKCKNFFLSGISIVLEPYDLYTLNGEAVTVVNARTNKTQLIYPRKTVLEIKEYILDNVHELNANSDIIHWLETYVDLLGR